MKKFILLFILFFLFKANSFSYENPAIMKSSANYLVILVHGIKDTANSWDGGYLYLTERTCFECIN